MRVIFISFGAIVVMAVALLTVRFWGQGQRFAEFQHPFFEGSTPTLIFKTNSLEETESVVATQPSAALWLDVRSTHDQALIVFARDLTPKELKELSPNEPSSSPSSNVAEPADRGPKTMAYDFAKVKALQPQAMLLKDLLVKYPKQRVVLNILDNVERIDLWIKDTLKDLGGEKRFILQSNYNVVMTSVKEQEPFWLFGCGQADLMRFMSFESMWILPAVPFKGDVFIAPFKLLGRTAFSEEILQEVQRRKKKIILGPLVNKAEFD
ncbi:MAG: hypothetical protein EOP06_09435, partial [Proteobacteria bacterium]